MLTTIKKLREMIDTGLITVDEAKGLNVKIGFMVLTVIGYELTPGDYMPNKWHLTYKGKAYEFTPYHGLIKAPLHYLSNIS